MNWALVRPLTQTRGAADRQRGRTLDRGGARAVVENCQFAEHFAGRHHRQLLSALRHLQLAVCTPHSTQLSAVADGPARRAASGAPC